MTISFFNEQIEMPSIQKTVIRNWVKQVAALHGKRVGEISYIFCNDEAKVRKLVLRGKRPSVKYMLITVPCIA